MHNEDCRGNGVPAIDLESGEFRHLTPHLLSSMKLPEDAHEHALLNSNEGTAVCSGSGQVSSKVVPEDVGSGDNDSSSTASPTTTDREPHDHSGLSCAPNDTSVSKNESATKDDTLAVPTIVVSEGGTHIFDFSNMSSQSSIVLSPKKAHLSRNSSSHEQCRVCQQEKDEDLITLGCQCRGELARAHRSCIDTWFRTKGSNKCEICQQVIGSGELIRRLEEEILHKGIKEVVIVLFGWLFQYSLAVCFWMY
uniref:RING-CH-type domain-containing protein n=1 Tax=Kalanchoe fedtschenkoi TaxID=63787 RepID=A0A7N0U977_KALFE